jgi:hypothetical protein
MSFDENYHDRKSREFFLLRVAGSLSEVWNILKILGISFRFRDNHFQFGQLLQSYSHHDKTCPLRGILCSISVGAIVDGDVFQFFSWYILYT